LPNSIVWIERETILSAHEAQLAEHGGAVGIRDENLLESALARPMHAAYADPRPDIPTLAAMYGIAFVRNHPFFDGNKRTGLIALELFLRLNGWRLTASNAECVVVILSRAAGEMSDERFTAWVRDYGCPSPSSG
jgi:death-on-curing protein